MKFCPNFNHFAKYVRKFDQEAELKERVGIDMDKERALRYNVWGTTQEQLQNLFTKGLDALPDTETSQHVRTKVRNALNRIEQSSKSAKEFMDEIINSDDNIKLSIAMHELMESIKGESDKARNLGFEISEVGNTGVLPAVPLARMAASIGRKIAFQEGYRFKSDKENKSTAAEIEALYYAIGKATLEQLADPALGYVDLHDGQSNPMIQTIKDYINEDEVGKDRVEIDILTNKAMAVSLNEAKMGIEAGTPEAAYFTDRIDADLTDSRLGVIVDTLGAARQITQPSTLVAPDTEATQSAERLAERDDPNVTPDAVTDRVRAKIYDTPVYVNSTMHSLLELLNAESVKTGKSASKLLKETFGNFVTSLFGIKRSDDYSIDKKASIAGQNLSKTVPMNDLVEAYPILQEGKTGPAPLHMPMKMGRNIRLYYENSILNAHASKQSRYMLTPGEYSVDTNSADFRYLVHGIYKALGDKDLTYKEFTEATGGKLDEALKAFKAYEGYTSLDNKLGALSDLSQIFPNADYVTLLTTMKAVQDIRNPKSGKVTTEFAVSADATASGGTLTFMQALGSNPNIRSFMQRIGLLTDNGDSATVRLNDLYGLMTETIEDFIQGKPVAGLISNPMTKSNKQLLKTTVELLFDEGKATRELSKDPTMTFVYGQGREGATKTLASKLADRVIDSLGDKNTRAYLAQLFNDDAYKNAEGGRLKDVKGLYKDIVHQLNTETGLTGQLYDLMDASINKQYLKEYKQRSNSIFELVKQAVKGLPINTSFKVLPAGAVLAGIKPTKANLKKYGMPLSKVMEVASKVPNGEDTVLTRKQKLMKTVMDVSMIHGIDAALLYHSLDQTMLDKGVIVVHDEVRGDVRTVRAMEEAYRDMAVRVAEEYDVHQQIMHAIEAYAPEVADSKAYHNLMSDIQADVAQKQEIIDTQFNQETHALIGDGNAFEVFAKGEKQGLGVSFETTSDITTRMTEQKRKKEQVEFTKEIADKAQVKKLLTKEQLMAFVEKVNSPLINKFLASGGKFDNKLTNMFYLDEDTVSISGTDSRLLSDGVEEVFINLETKEGVEVLKNIIEHEITHAFTVGYIAKALDKSDTSVDTVAVNDIKYIKKSVDALAQYYKGIFNGLPMVDDYAHDRIEYILSNNDPAVQISEFVAIMQGEPKAAKGIYEAINSVNKTLDKRKTESAIKRLIKAVTDFLLNKKQTEIDGLVDPKILQNTLARTLNKGISFKIEQRKLALTYQRALVRRLNAGGLMANSSTKPSAAQTKAAEKAKGQINYLNYAVASILNSKLERRGKRLLGNLHDMISERFPRYTQAVNRLAGIYDDSDALQGLMHAITGNGTDKVKKANLLAQSSKVMAQQIAIVNDQVGKFHDLLRPLSDEQKTTIGRFVTDMPLHDYFVLADKFVTEEAIAAEVTRLEKSVRKIDPGAVKHVDDLIAWNVEHKTDVRGKIHNLDAKYPIDGSNFGEDVRKLLVLKSIQTIGAKDFEQLLANTELLSLIKDNVVANRLSLLKSEGTHLMSDSLIMEQYKEPYVAEAVTLEEMNRYVNGENTGWKVLREPKNGELGVVYKYVIDASNIMGAFTDIKLNSSDITVTGKKTESPGLVETREGGRKLRLTQEEKLKLGLIEDFSQALVKTTAHNLSVQDSQAIRDALLREETRMVVGKDTTKLKDIIASENIDNPWFIKLEEGTSYDSLDASIKAKYKMVGERASNVKNFNENVDLVRKDISHWLLGGSSSSLFQNPQMKWATRIVKDFISGSKIGMVVMNPMKIFQDNVSNVSYLGVMGVPPVFIAKNYKNIARDFQEYSDLMRQVVQLKVQLVARPESDKIKKQIKALRARVAKSPLGDIADKGFVNSLGSDLVAKNADTQSGLQADMHTALEYLLTEKAGNRNYVSHFISKLMNLGFSGEDFLTYIGSKTNKTGKTGEGMKAELDQVAERLKTLRTDDDIVNYVSQYTNSPASEAVRLGASTTDLTDVMAKETLYRHLVENESMSPEDARIRVLDSFPDYKENMPLAVKQLSDMGIIMFPSFWLRIQKVIYRMMRDKPINLAAELMFEEALGSNVNTIIDANIINKHNSWGGLGHSPFEHPGVNSLVPMHIW